MNQYVELLDALCEKFGIAVDWTQGNIVPYIQQLTSKYVDYRIWTSVACIIALAILFVIVAGTFFFMNKHAHKINRPFFDCYDEGILLPLFIVSFFVLFISFIGIVINSFDIVTALTFPEKLVLEYLKSMS